MESILTDNVLLQFAQLSYENDVQTREWNRVAVDEGGKTQAFVHPKIPDLAVVTFRGTSDFMDIVLDIQTLMGVDFSGRFQRSLNFAFDIASRYKYVIFVGHSLGSLKAGVCQWQLFKQGKAAYAWMVNAYVPPSIPADMLTYNKNIKVFLNLMDPVSRLTYYDAQFRAGTPDAHWVIRSASLAELIQHDPQRWINQGAAGP